MPRSAFLNNTQIALDILRGIWLLHDADALLPYALRFLERKTPDTSLSEYQPTISTVADTLGSGASGSKKQVLVLPIHTALTKYDTCTTYGTADIAAQLVQYASKKEIIGVVLDIDSPGGSSNAIMPLVNAIAQVKEMGKPVIAHVDFCASAAMWVASQCDAIFMDNSLSEVGSIGAYATIYDNRHNLQTGERLITVYADESGDKNRGIREALDGKYDTVKADLSRLVKDFHDAVKAGRPSLKADADGVLSGAMFRPAEAIKNGLADGMGSLDYCIENVFIRAEFK